MNIGSKTYKLVILPILKYKTNSQKKRYVNKICEDKSRTLCSISLLSENTQVVFKKIVIEIEGKVDSVKSSQENTNNFILSYLCVVS